MSGQALLSLFDRLMQHGLVNVGANDHVIVVALLFPLSDFFFALDASVTDTQIRVLRRGFVHVLTTPWKIAQVHRTATKTRYN